jgi:hypothetical protein
LVNKATAAADANTATAIETVKEHNALAAQALADFNKSREAIQLEVLRKVEPKLDELAARLSGQLSKSSSATASTLQSASADVQRAAKAAIDLLWFAQWRWAAMALVVFGIVVLGVRWSQEPVIERQIYGCTAGWDQKTQICKGKWVKLQ